MANLRIHRQSCESGRLPPVCICCGGQANELIRHSFHRSPTWQIAFLPVILLLGVVGGVASGLRFRRFHNPLVGDAIEFPVPLCETDRSRLKWHSWCLVAVVTVLLLAAVVLVIAGVSMVLGERQHMPAQAGLMEAVLFSACGMTVVLVGASMFLQLITPRVTDFTVNYLDMSAVAPEFADAVSKTRTSPLAGYGQPMGSALTAGMVAGPDTRQVVILGGTTLALISILALVNYVGRASTIGMFKQGAVHFQSKARQWHEKVLSDVKKRMAADETPEKSPVSSDPASAEAEPVADSQPPAPFPVAVAEGSPFADAAEVLAPGSTQPEAPPRVEEFKVFGRERFPPRTRDIPDTSQLQPGMEVWASAGLTWYRSTVVRVDNRRVARVRFPASSKLPERPVPVNSIRLPAEGEGGPSL